MRESRKTRRSARHNPVVARATERRSVKTYLAHSLAPSTRTAYEGDLARFLRWGGTIPANAEVVARYLAYHASLLRPSTLTRNLAAIAHAHATRNTLSPTTTPLVKATLRGIRRTHGMAQKQALPIEPVLIQQITANHPSFSVIQNIRDRALLLVGFAGGFRRSELAGLQLGCIRFTDEGVILNIRASKTDPYAKGREVAIPTSKTKHCPVAALQKWLCALRPHVDIPSLPIPLSEVPLFARIDKHGHVCLGMRAAAVGGILRRRLAAFGYPTAGYSAHSLRAGLVTSAAKAGVPLWAIQRQTGQRSIHTVQRYIRNLGAFDCNAASTLL